MNEDDLLKYFEGRLATIENVLLMVDTAIQKITNIFDDVDHRCESIEAAMEKMLDILRAHDDLHEKYASPDAPRFVKT